MSKEYFSRVPRSDDAERRHSPTPPVITEGRDDGLSVTSLAPKRLPAIAKGRRPMGIVEAGRTPRPRTSWGVLSFGLLLLTSGAVCLERLTWMSGH